MEASNQSKSVNPQDERRKIKQLLKQRMQQKTAKGEIMQQPEQQFAQPKSQNRGPTRIDTEEDFRKMPYEGKAKYDNQLKALNALKSENADAGQRPKRMFFQHYDINEPYCPVIQNNTNPSGRPPNISPQMYEGITVKPKRPWVYLGNENMPPVEYQGLNQSQFKSVQRKNIDPEKDQMNRRKQQGGQPRKKGPMKAEKQDFGVDDKQQFELSDEMPMEDGQSIFASKYDTESKVNKSKVSKKSSMKNSDLYLEQDDQMVSDGTQTKKRHMSMFKDSGEDDDYGYQNSEYDDEDNMKSNSKNNKTKSKKDAKYKKKQEDLSDEQ